jgi:hypothetical protein
MITKVREIPLSEVHTFQQEVDEWIAEFLDWHEGRSDRDWEWHDYEIYTQHRERTSG